MEEEKKVEEATVEEVKAEEVQEQPSEGLRPESKNALMSFIFSVVGFAFAFAHLASIVGVVFGIVALVFHKKIDREVEQQPFRVFGKVAKIVGLVDIIAGAISFVVWLIVTIVTVVGAAIAASQGA